MAVKVTKKSGGTVKEIFGHIQKKLGENSGNYGGSPIQMERIPTGLLPFDIATGGGIPRGRCTVIFGPESSNKTNVALLTVAANQRLRPDEDNVWIAVEPFDGPWAKKMGVDIDKLLVLYPSTAEETVDMAEMVLSADNIGVVVVDSLAAMLTTQELNSEASVANVGGTGLAIGKLVRKTTFMLREQEKKGKTPTLIYVNQTRFKIGVLYGNPEDMPGGNAPKFQAALWVRVYGKNVMDEKVSDQFPALKEVSVIIKKFKVPIVSMTSSFSMVVHPHNGLNIGETDDIHTIKAYLEQFGHWEKHKNGWEIIGEVYPTQKAFKDKVYNDKKFGADVRKAIVERIMADQDGLLQPNMDPEPETDADGVVVDAE